MDKSAIKIYPSGRNGVSVNNARNVAKVRLRQDILARLHGRDTSVLELFCGAGYMYDKVWNQADEYAGVDNKDYCHNIVSDCQVYVRSNDLKKYNIIDIDPYGSPYGVVQICFNGRAQNNQHHAQHV
jgi:coenzyme F420-reducing hydrogenase beta subunit